ncbi:MAG: NADH-quinone oxidoreductase subunit N [Rickettsiales bacterium]|nr:NADH-quinone oxidoreductase subunit N [Rickettsiales bacterium]
MSGIYLRFLPELGLLGLALVLFFIAVGPGQEADEREPADSRRKRLIRAAIAGDRVALVGGGVVLILAILAVRQAGPLFFGAYRVALFSQVIKIILAAGLFFNIWLAQEAQSLAPRERPELMLFLSLSTLGMMMLVSADELISFYVALEIAAYSLYILVPLTRGHGDHNEAAFKYFLYGAATSAVALFGMSILFGLAGSSSIPQIATALSANPSTLAVTALLLTLGGVFFKLAVFPFHFWAPDVYQTTSHSVAAFIAGTSKVGAVAALLRLLLMGLSLDQLYWLLGALALLSMSYGNLAALAQRDFKRLLAYSGVAQGGYILLGLAALDSAAYAAASYYAIAYLALMLLCFLVVIELGRTRHGVRADGSTDNSLPIDALGGLYSRSPWLALALMIGLLGLAGVPPTAGFSGKWFLFKAILDQGGFWWVLIAGINNTIAVYYYLVVLKAAYVTPAADGATAIETSLWPRALTLSVGLGVVVLGIAPQIIMPTLQAAVSAMIGS